LEPNYQSPPSLPKVVKQVRDYLIATPSHDLFDISRKLIPEDAPEDDGLGDNPLDLVGMWVTLERRYKPSAKRPIDYSDDDLWVWSFLSSAASARQIPKFQRKTPDQCGELLAEIQKLSKKLGDKLKHNGLDCHLVALEGEIFNGIHVYEDFGDSNRYRIDRDGTPKVLFSDVLNCMAERAAKVVRNDYIDGKKGKNFEAIRFIRIIAARNVQLYGSQLNAVLATAANAIFGTKYPESAITNLLNR